MTTTLSSKGQIVLPRLARTKLHLSPGAKFTCEVQGDNIILKPQAPKPKRRELVTDEITGLRVTKSNGDECLVTSDIVKAILADFP
jgi:AbrB family looped-hinge helix DNA binding protein